MFKKLKEWWLNYVIRTAVERIPIANKLLKLVDGKKTLVGKVGAYLSLMVAALQWQFPEIPHINEVNAAIMFIVSWILEQVGEQHKADKELREKFFQQEFQKK